MLEYFVSQKGSYETTMLRVYNQNIISYSFQHIFQIIFRNVFF